MFHVELRRFPRVSRKFNLSREELQESIVRPWLAGAAFEFDDETWEPQKARLAIYEGPALSPQDMGLGRGWANAVRASEDVTARVLEVAHGSVSQFKDDLLGRGRVTLAEVVELASAQHPGARASERLALAEQAVWELLHEGRVTITGPAGTVERPEWGPALLEWATWAAGTLVVEPGG